MVVIPSPAATVILMRETPANSLETFLLKRHEASAFMGGNFVYPGGRMEPEDLDRSVLSHCRGLRIRTATDAREEDIDEKELLGYPICALRELFEEAGVLLAYDRSGELLATASSPDEDQFALYRGLIETKGLSMTELARRENLLYAMDQLFYVDRWITPEARNIRFDTRFYLAFCPVGQRASSDQKETVQGLWLSPPEALEANLSGSIALSPPAVETLELLSSFETRTSLLKFLNNREPRTVLPLLTKAADGPVILFPWDEEYETLSQSPEPIKPRRSRIRNVDEKTTRVLLKDGRWLPCKPDVDCP